MTDDNDKRIEGAPAKRKRGRPPKSAELRGSETSSPVTKAVKVYVAKGKSITSKRGILEAGELVSESDFDGGSERVAQLVESGYLEAR